MDGIWHSEERVSGFGTTWTIRDAEDRHKATIYSRSLAEQLVAFPELLAACRKVVELDDIAAVKTVLEPVLRKAIRFTGGREDQ